MKINHTDTDRCSQGQQRLEKDLRTVNVNGMEVSSEHGGPARRMAVLLLPRAC